MANCFKCGHPMVNAPKAVPKLYGEPIVKSVITHIPTSRPAMVLEAVAANCSHAAIHSEILTCISVHAAKTKARVFTVSVGSPNQGP